jgi:hypothetical protein
LSAGRKKACGFRCLRAERDVGPAGEEKRGRGRRKGFSFFLLNFFSNSFFKHSNFKQTGIHAFES